MEEMLQLYPAGICCALHVRQRYAFNQPHGLPFRVQFVGLAYQSC